MSSWSTPGGDDYRSYTGEPRVPQDSPPYAAPQGAPYGPPQGPPYGGPAMPALDPYGTPYGTPSPYGMPGSYGGMAPYGSRPPMTSGWRHGTTTLIVLSAVLTFIGCGLGLPSLIISIVAMTRAHTDGRSGTRLAKVGWVCFGVAAVLLAAFWTFVVVTGAGRQALPAQVQDV
ncbi:MAG: hypothetical protein M3Y71_06620 [Actinomycetota bacterium]|nr:hypothetical protein [Actinomycetota bacterium]